MFCVWWIMAEGSNGSDFQINGRDSRGRFTTESGRWRPGESGNPSGRPKGWKTYAQRLDRAELSLVVGTHWAEALHRDLFGDLPINPAMVIADLLVHAHLRESARGGAAYLKEALDRKEGKVIEPKLDLNAKDFEEVVEQARINLGG